MFKFSDTTIIFDWDDTLLSSSWLAANNMRLDFPGEIPKDVQDHLECLQDSVINLMGLSVTYGTVVIITNAETGWVEQSCRRFMPRVLPWVSRVKVLSARSTYEALHPEAPCEWKYQAFAREIYNMYASHHFESRKNIISFGDSIHERQAIHRVKERMGTGTRTKSIKFVERPTVEQLKRQVDVVASIFDEIARHHDSLDLMLTIQLFQQ